MEKQCTYTPETVLSDEEAEEALSEIMSDYLTAEGRYYDWSHADRFRRISDKLIAVITGCQNRQLSMWAELLFDRVTDTLEELEIAKRQADNLGILWYDRELITVGKKIELLSLPIKIEKRKYTPAKERKRKKLK